MKQNKRARMTIEEKEVSKKKDTYARKNSGASMRNAQKEANRNINV